MSGNHACRLAQNLARISVRKTCLHHPARPVTSDLGASFSYCCCQVLCFKQQICDSCSLVRVRLMELLIQGAFKFRVDTHLSPKISIHAQKSWGVSANLDPSGSAACVGALFQLVSPHFHPVIRWCIKRLKGRHFPRNPCKTIDVKVLLQQQNLVDLPWLGCFRSEN